MALLLLQRHFRALDPEGEGRSARPSPLDASITSGLGGLIAGTKLDWNLLTMAFVSGLCALCKLDTWPALVALFALPFLAPGVRKLTCISSLLAGSALPVLLLLLLGTGPNRLYYVLNIGGVWTDLLAKSLILAPVAILLTVVMAILARKTRTTQHPESRIPRALEWYALGLTMLLIVLTVRSFGKR